MSSQGRGSYHPFQSASSSRSAWFENTEDSTSRVYTHPSRVLSIYRKRLAREILYTKRAERGLHRRLSHPSDHIKPHQTIAGKKRERGDETNSPARYTAARIGRSFYPSLSSVSSPYPALLSCAARHMSSVTMGESLPGRGCRRMDTPLPPITAREICSSDSVSGGSRGKHFQKEKPRRK